MPEEQTQISQLRSGGEQALADAMAEHAFRLRLMVQLRLDPRVSGRFDAGDVLQEAYLEARKRLPRYLDSPGVPLFVWLRGVVLDTLIDFHRRHLGTKRRDAAMEVPLNVRTWRQASSVCLAAQLAESLTSPSQAAIREETARQIEAALSQMDEIDRDVLLMRHFEQLTNDEVAAVLGVKKAAASRRYMRALERLRKVVSAIPDFEQ